MLLRRVRIRQVHWLAAPLVVAALGYGARPLPSDDAPPGAASTRAPKPEPRTVSPSYTEQGELKLPADYRKWIFVGANLGLEYRDNAAAQEPADPKADSPARPANFHNVYINPEAYDVYMKTGRFPEKTVLILDIYKAESGEPKSVVAEGKFPGRHVGIAAAVKNSARPDGSKTDWAYYEFALDRPVAKAFPDKACYDCHLEHAKDDNVWTQFYPSLSRVAGRR